MQQDENIDFNQAMEMLNTTLKEMKGELGNIDTMPLKGSKKKMAKHMHKIYDELSDLTEKYKQTHDHDDLNQLFKQIELLKPTFFLNYNEIVD